MRRATSQSRGIIIVVMVERRFIMASTSEAVASAIRLSERHLKQSWRSLASLPPCRQLRHPRNKNNAVRISWLTNRV